METGSIRDFTYTFNQTSFWFTPLLYKSISNMSPRTNGLGKLNSLSL